MTITAALVLFAVIWFMTLLVILPIRIKTQGDLGDIVPGTHAGAPEIHHMKKKMWITTGVSVVLWAIIAGIILSGVISIRDFDWLNQLEPRE
ncbi:DUF1467 family protein [Rhodobacteraceae bacterium B1Z28]|uniref:DUF1467 family protein n=1 Tax=Ruegeria haliotis TaxID=2747601 RepID=A0ABX2PJZ1_9RHOB|nr:DUF1467 family protein [Ruegeria haliotis]NVO54416.1 DUF1467 family protein [Ruegeria haliotis]